VTAARPRLVVRNDVERCERELADALTELGHAARAAVDPRCWIRRRPLACTVGAFAVGLWLGGRRALTTN
jgi:hypothetical protein